MNMKKTPVLCKCRGMQQCRYSFCYLFFFKQKTAYEIYFNIILKFSSIPNLAD